MTSGHITTSAGKVAYRQSAGTGPTIVLVHGNSASSKAFARQLDGTLGRTYRVIAYDLPGHGESDDAADPAKTYTMPGYARVLREVVAQLGANDAVFVGWSLGGHPAWWIWLFIHISFLISFRNKLLVLTNWIWNYFTYDKGNRLIIRPYIRKDDSVTKQIFAVNETDQ